MIKKTKICICPLMALGLVLMITGSCKKEEEKRVSVLTTTAAMAITTTTATCGGNVTSDGNAPITERGICYNTASSPTTASDKLVAAGTTGVFTSNLTNLTAGATYYVRAYATNSVGTAYGNEVSFSTIPLVLPILTTTATTAITTTTAISGGNVVSDGNATITERGICYSTTTSPTTANSKLVATGTTGAFTSNLSDLTAGAIYYVRTYATNSVGTAYGNEISFTTYNVDAISDIDNNYYNIITIGTQTWMKENLKTTKYCDGSTINNIIDNTAWTTQTTGAYCWFNNDAATYKATYGALYNYYTVVDSRKLCPTGWHIPTDAEWIILEAYLGGSILSGGKLKATTLWVSPNTGADNNSGFAALPGSYRDGNNGLYGDNGYDIGNNGNWWSVTEGNATNAWDRNLNYNSSAIFRNFCYKRSGFSVRCLRD
jgi:uncharacterized protein (TIGR02145 family)